jgi:pimeloyl-ACP methyl ester carboxylesterase
VFTEQSFVHDALRLNYVIGPASGPPLVLLHGVTRCWQDFVPLLGPLASRWQVHALDLRGHGRSQRSPGRYRVVDYVGDVTAFLGGQIRKPAVLYGHSLGALTAAGAAAAAPDGVRALVLEDPPSSRANIRHSTYFGLFDGMRELARQRLPVPQMARALAELRLSDAEGRGSIRLGAVRDATALRFLARSLRELDPEALSPIIEGGWLEGFDVESIFRGVSCPALVLRGDEVYGGMLPGRDAAWLAGLMPDCTVIDVPAVGHLIHWMQTETTLRLVTGFLESL